MSHRSSGRQPGNGWPDDMKQIFRLLVCLIAVDGHASENWPMFRGPNGSGVSATARPPLKFGPDENVSWNVEVPSSPSSPCVWGERIFLTTFADSKLETRCYSSNNGKLLWTRAVPSDKLEAFQKERMSSSPSSPVAAGR